VPWLEAPFSGDADERCEALIVMPVLHQMQGGGGLLCVPSGASLVFDPLENLFPMDCDILRCIHPETNLRAIYAKNGHDDVRTDPDDLSNSPRKY
jgi:hypothetical protein